MVILSVAYYLLGGIAIGLGLHRLLSHHSFTLPKWLERTIITLSLPAGTPIQWAGNHRFHHANTDAPNDPHSPHISGFWYAHVGWYIGTRNIFLCILYSLAGPLRMIFDGIWRPRTNQQYNYLAADVSADPYYKWLSRPLPYLFFVWLHAFIIFGLAYYLAGWAGFAWMWFQLACMYNFSDAIDSVSHIFGKRPFTDKHLACNGRIMSILTLGEGWHANHHSFPYSARHGILPGQFDWTWQVIKTMEKLGLAKNIKLPTQQQINAKLIEA